MSVRVLGADRTGFRGAVTGGESRFTWAKMSPAFFVRVVRRWDPKGDAAADAACLLRAVGAPDAPDAWLVVAGATGAKEADLFARIAHWRSEAAPAGGYVVHGQRYVRPEERDRLVREEAITAALLDVEAKDVVKRRAAYDALLAHGKDAHARLKAALTGRRARLLDAIAHAPSASGTKHKAKLYRLLEERRSHALALIRDTQAYPYPNPEKKGQAEVETRVDAVRQVWERPFELIIGWDKSLAESLGDVTEVDEVLARVDPGYAPELHSLMTRLSAQVNMPSYAPGSDAGKREYSLKVLAFNVAVATTATREEKDNVRAVNEYRMMMGEPAVKIHERLVRAARGHSRHMREQGYFAHDVPANMGATVANRTPGARAKAQGYGGGVGENIASGTWTGRDAFLAWFGSSGHHRNMVRGGWTEMGAGRSGGSSWTQLFGAATGTALKQIPALDAPAANVAPEPEDEEGRPRPAGDAQVPDGRTRAG